MYSGPVSIQLSERCSSAHATGMLSVGSEALEKHVTSAYGTVPVHYIGRSTLIPNKLAAGRPKDLADVAALERRQVP